jgi:hypothetical protein
MQKLKRLMNVYGSQICFKFSEQHFSKNLEKNSKHHLFYFVYFLKLNKYKTFLKQMEINLYLRVTELKMTKYLYSKLKFFIILKYFHPFSSK